MRSSRFEQSFPPSSSLCALFVLCSYSETVDGPANTKLQVVPEAAL